MLCMDFVFFFFSSRRRHTRLQGDWSSDVCSSDLAVFDAISLLGSPVMLTILALAVALLLAARREWIVLAGWLAAFAGGGLLDVGIGRGAGRGRVEISGGAGFFKKKKNGEWVGVSI